VAPRDDEVTALATLLGEALTDAAPNAKRIREAGRAWGRNWSRQAANAEPDERLRTALERLGFVVKVAGTRLQLRACPCPLVANRAPARVCELVDAVADGILEETALRVESRRHDPQRRMCAVKLAAMT
jgi:predicted ArsR family transcriptional regulator